MIPYALYNVYANIPSKYVMFESSFSQNLDHFVMCKESVKVITMANTPKLLISAEGSRFWALENLLQILIFWRGISWFFEFFPCFSIFCIYGKRWLFSSSEYCTMTKRHCESVWQPFLFWICMPKSCRAEYGKPRLPLKWFARVKSSIIQPI